MKKNFRKEKGYILLGDIADFLKITSDLDDLKKADYLQKFFIFTIEKVKINNGELIKFIGDAFLAIFQNEEDIVRLKNEYIGNYNIRWRTVYGKFVKGEFGTKEFRFKDIFGDIINKLFMEA